MNSLQAELEMLQNLSTEKARENIWPSLRASGLSFIGKELGKWAVLNLFRLLRSEQLHFLLAFILHDQQGSVGTQVSMA